MFFKKNDDELSLKLLELSDAEKLFELTNKSRDYLKVWLPWLESIVGIEDTTEFIQKCLKGYSENESMHTVILFKSEMAGIISFNNINWSNKTANIGYWIGEDFQGNGIMTKAVKTMTCFALNELNLNKVEIRAAVGNKKSRSIPERLSFLNEGCIRQAEFLYNHYVDHIVYGVLKEEWNKNNDLLY